MKRIALCLTVTIALTACYHRPRPDVSGYELRWSGAAEMQSGGRPMALAVRSWVTPFVRARAESWPTAQGPSAKRVMLIEGNRGSVERDGRREPLSAAMTLHERQQFAIYGLMLMAPKMRRDGEYHFTLKRPDLGLPPTDFWFDRRGRMVEARNQVPDAADPRRMINQRFVFSGTMPAKVQWPQEIRILQNEQPYYTIRFTSFSVGA